MNTITISPEEESKLIKKMVEPYFWQYRALNDTLGVGKAREWLAKQGSIVQRAVDEIIIEVELEARMK